MKKLFGKRESPSEKLKRNQKCLNKVMREIDREKKLFELKEKEITIEIKKMAKINQMDSVYIMAKQLVKTRNYRKKLSIMKANIQEVSLKITTLKSQDSIDTTMKSIVISMKKMSNCMNLPRIKEIMMDFEKESKVVDIKNDIIDDAFDDIIDDSDKTESVINSILDELGIQIKDKLNNLPVVSNKVEVEKKNKLNDKRTPPNFHDDLHARLQNLKRK